MGSVMHVWGSMESQSPRVYARSTFPGFNWLSQASNNKLQQARPSAGRTVEAEDCVGASPDDDDDDLEAAIPRF